MESKFIVWQVRYYNDHQITLNHVREIVVWQLSYKDHWDLNPEVIGLAIANQVSVTIRMLEGSVLHAKQYGEWRNR